MRKQLSLLSISTLLLLFPGCQKTEPVARENHQAAPANDSIIIDIGEHLDVQHEAKPGQTLEWRASSPNTPRFWIQFTGPSPCKNQALFLPGSSTTVASCVVGSPSAGTETVTYSYIIRTTPPPSAGPIPDRAVPCIGCTD